MSCYREFGWTPDQVAELQEAEAMKLAVLFQEQSRHERKLKKDQPSSGGGRSVGLQAGFEEEFSFGDEEEQAK